MSYTLYQLSPSPNSIKVRLALGLKQIPCTLQDTNPADRTALVALSGQSLTPVLTDGDRVIYDSYAILRYLDANNPKAGPRLFSNERSEHKEIEATIIIRGMRAVSDFEYEFQMALMNRRLYPDVETVFLTPKEEYLYLSSRLVREVVALGGDVAGLVPDPVRIRLEERFRKATHPPTR